MPIISVSLPDSMLADLQRLQAATGAKGQSELVRRGLSLLLAEHRQMAALKGRVAAAVLAVHPETADAIIAQQKHAFEAVVRTHIHHKARGRCMELFILEGAAAEIHAFADALESSKKLEYVKLLVA